MEVLRDNPEEKMLSFDDIEQNLFEYYEAGEDSFIDGYKKQESQKKAADFIKKKFDIDADYSKIPLDVANMMNRELVRARNIFGTCGLIEKITHDRGEFGENDLGSYDRDTKIITLLKNVGIIGTRSLIKKKGPGWFSTNKDAHIYRHEIGHAILNYIENLLTNYANTKKQLRTSNAWQRLLLKLDGLYADNFYKTHKGDKNLSRYARKNFREMVAESLAQVMSGKPGELAQQVFEILKEAQDDFSQPSSGKGF